MKNKKRFDRTLKILAQKLSRKEYEFVSITLCLLWGGVQFDIEDVLSFSKVMEDTYSTKFKYQIKKDSNIISVNFIKANV